MLKYLGTAILLAALATVASAQDTEAEIDYLLEAVGSSSCIFIRNGSRHDAASAEDHLRLKYRNGRKYVTSAEEFITRLASESSWTGRSYTIDCPDIGEQPSGDWLSARLAEYRAADSAN